MRLINFALRLIFAALSIQLISVSPSHFMDALAGYSSGSDDTSVPLLPEVNQRLELAPKTKLHQNFEQPQFHQGGTFANRVEREYYDNATLTSQKSYKRSGEQKRAAKRLKKERKKKTSKDDSEFLGPWAGYESDNEAQQYESFGEEDEEKITEGKEDLELDSDMPTTQHFVDLYLSPPEDVEIDFSKKPGSQVFQVPTRVATKLDGHSKGVTKLRLFPNSGHLLLSCGNDSEIKLWDMYHENNLLRAYYGHSQAVKDICFTSSGQKFISCGFDKRVIVWNTKSGAIEKSMVLEAIPNCLLLNPNNEHELLVALSNSKIHHFDLSSESYKDPIQTYDHHQSSVNFLMAVDSNKRFLSTSDDKSVRIWDWQINIPIKIISEPDLHSIPRGIVSRNFGEIALQSMASSIDVVQGQGKFRTTAKKFRGHSVSGYAVDINFSADGRVIMSGDSRGLGVFWYWNSGKLVKKLKVSTKVISCIEPHPQEPSTVVMAGLTGEIYICK